VAGIVTAGADVMLVGPLPTPGIAFITSSMRADAGVVISASHNPYQDNGIKIFAADGFKLPDEVEADLERRMSDIAAGMGGGMAEPGAIGKAVRIEDARGRYVQFLKHAFPRELTLDGVKIVVDCANGAAYQVAPRVFEELGAEVHTMGVTPDGRNINDGCGALHPEKLAAEVQRVGAHLGVALDGDADRLILVDETGTVVDGDQVMAILGTRMLLRGELPGKTVVATVMSNLGLERALAAKGGKLLRTAVGDRYVVEAMREGGFLLGGEQSGHIVFLDHATTGDGMVAALRVLAVMGTEERPLSELGRAMVRYPQVLLNFSVARKRPFDEMPAVQEVIARVEGDLGAEGRVVVRYSGTESKARVMIEGTDLSNIRARAEEIADSLKRELAAAS
jgi:phosphoglucosamine mutase